MRSLTPRTPGRSAQNAAHQQINLNSRLRCLVQRQDHFLISKRIILAMMRAGLPCGMLRFARMSSSIFSARSSGATNSGS